MTATITTPISAAETAHVTQAKNPATGDVIGAVDNTDLSQFPEMMQRARQAQAQWQQLSYKERAPYLLKMRDYIVANAEQLSDIVSASTGKTRTDALATEVLPCSMACTWYAKHTHNVLKPRSIPIDSILFFNKKSQMTRLPIGVVGIISPWNYPLSIPFGEIVMGLMAGNAIMLKVAAATPLVGQAINDIVAAAELPEGLFQQVVGSGGAVSQTFLSQGVDKIFFTGSVGVGQQLMEQAAKTLTPLSLELGGNDPMIVMADANLERAANGAAWAGYQNAGQSCGGVERIYVDAKIYDEFVALLGQKTAALRHGHSNDHQVDMGSLTTESQLRTVQNHLEDALAKGAKIIAQSRPVGSQNGYFHPATLLVNVTDDMLLMREETFGPLLPVVKFDSLDDAITAANASDLALTSSVWSKDLAQAKQVAARLESGVTTINDHLYTHGLSEMPWGGWKKSGLGRTHGPEGLLEMTHAKVINWDILNAPRNLWWYPFDANNYQALLDAQRFAFPQNGGEFIRKAASLSPTLVKKMFSKWRTPSR